MTTGAIQNVLSRLQRVKRTGEGQFMARCPAHDDSHASLSIGQGDKGIVLHCHAGCTTEDVVGAMGLTVRDLFTGAVPRPPKSSSHSAKMRTIFRTAEEAFAEAGRQTGGEFVTAWQYPGDTFRVARFALGDGGKTFRPIHRVGSGWAMGDPAGALPLYRGDEIPGAGPVFTCEGEKASDAAWSVGLPAVTSAHGAQSASKSDWSTLAGREIVLLPDHDVAGMKYAQEVAGILTALKPPAAVKIVELPGLEEGGDIVDWTNADGPMGSKSADEIRSAILQMAAAAPFWTVAEKEGASSQPPPIIRPTFMYASDLLAGFPTQREPVIEGLLRRGEVGNLVSAPKMNKSWFLLNTALCVALGRPVLKFPSRPGRVLLLDYELAPGTLAKRLRTVMEAMDLTAESVGDRLAIESLRGRRLDVDGLGGYFGAITPGTFDLVILDPLYRTFPRRSLLTRSFDENSNADLADLYGTLCGHAERLDAGLLVVHHLTKGPQGGKAITDLGAGGGAQARAADAHLAIRPHAQDGAAVLSGVVRSFPPFEPICMRWDFPLWQVADDLDPADLKKAQLRRSQPKEETPEAPAKPSFNANRFATEFLAETPRSRATIIGAANAAGINDHQAGKFLDRAEGQGLAFRWKQPKDKRAYFASRPQPLLTDQSDTETHT